MSDKPSDYAVLLRALDFAAAEVDSAIYEEAASAIRALEAKVREAENWNESCEAENRKHILSLREHAQRLEDDRDRLAAENAKLRADAERWQRDVADAYGWLWCVNEEPGTPNRFPAERAAYNARKLLRELLTHEQRGIGINNAVIQRDAARRAGEGE